MTSPEIIPEDSSLVKGLRVARWFVWFVWAYFIFVLIILTLTFVLLLANANPDAEFVDWVYRSADRAMEPFRGIFPAETAGNGSVLDFSILFAILVYGIVAMLINGLVSFIDRKVAEERQKAFYIAQETERRREVARAANVHQTTAQRMAAQEAAAQELAVQQAAAQQRTADAAEQLAGQQAPEPTPPPPPTSEPPATG